MEIRDNFRVSTSIDEIWGVLLDVERIAPCMPGAQLQEVEGDEYRGIVKVKVGPITAQYKGAAVLREVDAAERKIVIDAEGRDTRGQGNAKATVVVTMRDDAGGTDVDVHTDLAITGKVAQFGRGVLGDVSQNLLRQFVENLERDVIGAGSAAPAPAAATPGAHSAGDGAGAATKEAASPPAEATAPTGPRKIDAPEAEPIDLLGTAGQSVVRRLLPAVGAVVLVLVVWRLLRGRR